jgi:hypothetical protein
VVNNKPTRGKTLNGRHRAQIRGFERGQIQAAKVANRRMQNAIGTLLE